MYNNLLYNSATYNEQAGSGALVTNEKYIFEVHYTGAFIDTSSNTVSFSDVNRVSFANQLYDGKGSALKFLLLDGNCKLNGEFALAPETQEDAKLIQFGWMGSRLCDATGLFNNKPIVTVSFGKTVFYNLLITFYPQNDEYATDFKVKLVNNGQVVWEQQFTNNTNAIFNYNLAQGVEATQIILEINRWSLGNTVAKVSELWTGYSESYPSDMILSLQIYKDLKDLFVVSAATELQIVLVNDGRFAKDKPLYNVLKPNRFVKLWYIDNNGIERLLFEGFTAKFKVREFDVQILAYSPFAQATDLNIDDTILQNYKVKNIAGKIVELVNEYSMPWNVVNNVTDEQVVNYHVLQTNIRRSIEEFAIAHNIRVRERFSNFVIGDNENVVHMIAEDTIFEKEEDRDFKTPTVLTVKYNELVRQKRTETRSETVQANEERLIQFQHGYLLSDAIVNVQLSSTKATYHVYRGKYVTSIKIIAGNEDVTANITMQFDELALNERTATERNEQALREYGRVTSTFEIPFTTEAKAREIGQMLLQFKPDIFSLKIPLNYEIDIDHILQIGATKIYVLKVRHTVNAYEQLTEIEGRAI